MTDRLNILILADRDARTLWPLTELAPPPLLPLGGKPLIDHVIEALATSVDANVLVVVAAGDTRTLAHVASLGFPRLAIQATDRPMPVVDRDALVLRGDIAMSRTRIQAFVADATARSDPEHGAWRLAAGDLTPTWRHTAMLAEQSDAMLPTLGAFWRMSIAAAREEIPGIAPAGWVGSDGLRVGLDSLVLTRRAPGDHALVGARAFVDKFVRIGEGVVIGDDCHVSKGASLRNAVILPRGYVGPGVELDNVILAGGWICKIDTGEVLRVGDNTIVGELAA